ncbi:MAG TPA: ribosome biogenesis GTPase Der [Gammaproteobacteria bacterium]|nr:ribosome biogenesis GTPase Der [Gammaproteobacteria bacterium]
MKPVLALVGRPNVGKSTLFNQLTRSRDALVADQPGLTRDRNYGEGKIGGRAFLVIDTGGLSGESEGIDLHMAQQAWQAVQEASTVLFLVDARAGLTAADQAIAQQLRESGKPVVVVANKAEGLDPALATAEFHALGLGEPLAVAAAHGQGIGRLVARAVPLQEEKSEQPEESEGIRVALVGRPNVGKSTLLNRILGEERVVVYDLPGTTRDSIFVPFERDGQRYVFIDTAGVRRRSRVKQAVEKFSIIKTLQAIDAAQVVIMVLDAREGISEQDAHLLGHVLDAGRAVLLAINKWDHLPAGQRDRVRRELELKLPFLKFAPAHFISALHGTGVGELFASLQRCYRSAMAELPTPMLTRLLEDAVSAHPPPLVRGRRIKLRYAHQGGRNPPVIVIHGNRVGMVPDAYRRYLANIFRRELRLEGTPLRIEFREGENPFAGRRNRLTRRQQEKRRRLVRYSKKRGA